MAVDDLDAPKDDGGESVKGRKLTDSRLKALLAKEIANAETDRTAQASRNARAMRYFNGDVDDDMPAQIGRSSLIDTTVSDNMGWIMPQILRLFTSSSRVVVCSPVGAEDDQWARDATLHLNHVFLRENPGYWNLQGATWDSLMTGNAIIKTFFDPTPIYEVTYHTGLTEEEYSELVVEEDDDKEDDDYSKDDKIEVLNKTEYDGEIIEMQQVQGPDGQPTMEPVPVATKLYDCRLRRLTRKGRNRVVLVPPEDYLKRAEATTCQEAIFQAHRQRKTKSDLILMKFDEDLVLKLGKDADTGGTEERMARDPDNFSDHNDPSGEEVWLYECYLRVDADGDHIAETVRAFYAGDESGGTVLDWEVWEDEIPFDDIPCEKLPHRFNARSLSDEGIDMMRARTAVLRGMMDNMYAINNPKKLVKGNLLNPDALFSTNFGSTVFADLNASVETIQTLPIMDKALPLMDFFDKKIQRATGIGSQGMAIDTDALQKQTATAVQVEHDAGFSQVEILARNMAAGWEGVFRKLLKLEIKHRDQPLWLRLHGKPVKIDPRVWNADMDVVVNTGLGTGSRERDVSMLQMTVNNQFMLAQKVAEAGMVDKALQMLPYVSRSMQDLTEATGLKNPDHYFPMISAEDVQALQAELQQKAGQPTPDMQLEQMKQQGTAQQAQAKAQADLQAKQIESQAKLQAEQIVQNAKLQAEQAKAEAQAQVAMVKNAAELEGDQGKLKMQQQIELAKIAADENKAAATLRNQLLIEAIKAGQLDIVSALGLAQGDKVMPIQQVMSDILEGIRGLTMVVMTPTTIERDPLTGAKRGIRLMDQAETPAAMGPEAMGSSSDTSTPPDPMAPASSPPGNGSGPPGPTEGLFQ